MKYFLNIVLIFCSWAIVHANLLENPQFSSSNGAAPDKWRVVQKKTDLGVFKCKDGVLSISEKSQSYGNNISQTIPVDGLKSYYFECEYYCDGLNFIGGITYDLLDKNQKKINKREFYILKTVKTQPEWKKIVYKIVIGDANVSYIKIQFVNYRSQEMQDKKIYFRNPVFRLLDGKQIKKPETNDKTGAVSKKKESTETADPFLRHKFIHKPYGTTYFLERDGAGFFRVETPYFKGKKVSLSVKSVKGMKFELFLYDTRTKESCMITPEMKDGTFFFDVPGNFRWAEWGNVLIFSADKTVPEKFEIEMIFVVSGGKIFKYKVPVEQTKQVKYPVKLPENNYFYSYHTFPLMRVPQEKIKGTLLEKLENSWRNTGWKRFSFNHIFSQIPVLSFHYKGVPHQIKPGLAPDGSETHFYCDSNYISFSSEYFAELLTKNGIADTIRKSPVMFWDYEPYVGGSVTLSCYCKNCISSFCKRYSLPANISAREILTKHLDKWIYFRCHQRSLSVGKIVKAMRLINPNVKVLFCSAPLPPKTEIQEELEYLKFYGVDIRLVDEFVDIQASMNYTPTLDYYKSLEREAKELRSCRMMILSNSWEDISSMRPGRVASHLFAAMFMGCNPPFMGQGLFLAPGTLLAKLKETINDVAVTEKFWHGSEFDFEKVPWKSLYMADGNFYMLGRKNPTGKVLFLVNNHEFETIYLKLSLDNTKFSNVYDLLNGTELLPYNNGVAIEIPPFSYRVVKFSTNKEALSQNGKVPTEKIEKLASELQREQQAAYKGMSRYDIHCRLNGTSYEVVTPSQKILFNLNRGAEAAWYVGGKKVMNTLGCDFFVNKDKSSTMISGVPVKLNSCRIFSDRAECIFSYRVANEGYRELTILKKFTVQRDSGIITVDIEIIPERGFRNFSYRMNNEFALGKSKKKFCCIPSEYRLQSWQYYR